MDYPGEAMSQIDLVSIRDGQSVWESFLAAFADVDVYTRYGYVRAAAGDDAMLVRACDNHGTLVIPLVTRVLPQGNGFDAESPYGYPGVLARGDVTACWQQLGASLAERGVINVFLRLHPFADHAACSHLLIGPPHATAWIPLTEGRAQAFAGGSCASHRTKVNRTRREGYTTHITEAPNIDDLRAFRVLYDATMHRLNATDTYLFDDAYYQQLADGLGRDLVLVTVRDPAGDTFAQALMFCGPHYGHYHLSGRRDVDNAAGNLLFEAMADHAAVRGLTGVHLGGGMSDSPDDSLLQFKQRLARGRSFYRVAGLVCDPARHQQLVNDWARRSGQTPKWFQSYRQPIALENSP
jgi:hypothetical protein